MSCFYCEKDQRLLELMMPLKELRWSNVYLFRDQKHRGRVVVALKEHHDEMWQLSQEQRAGFFDEVASVAKAVSEAMGADKINYAIYGDLVSHFHVHLVPKKRDELQWGGPFTDTLPKVFLRDEEYGQISAAILAKLA